MVPCIRTLPTQLKSYNAISTCFIKEKISLSFTLSSGILIRCIYFQSVILHLSTSTSSHSAKISKCHIYNEFLNIFLLKEICFLLDWCKYCTDAWHSLLGNIKLFYDLANNIFVKVVYVRVFLFFLKNEWQCAYKIIQSLLHCEWCICI
jgi:hypothetical protein